MFSNIKMMKSFPKGVDFSDMVDFKYAFMGNEERELYRRGIVIIEEEMD